MRLETLQDCSGIKLVGTIADQLLGNLSSDLESVDFTVHRNCNDDSTDVVEFTITPEDLQPVEGVDRTLTASCLGTKITYEFGTFDFTTGNLVIDIRYINTGTTIPLNYPYDMNVAQDRIDLNNDVAALGFADGVTISGTAGDPSGTITIDGSYILITRVYTNTTGIFSATTTFDEQTPAIQLQLTDYSGIDTILWTTDNGSFVDDTVFEPILQTQLFQNGGVYNITANIVNLNGSTSECVFKVIVLYNNSVYPLLCNVTTVETIKCEACTHVIPSVPVPCYYSIIDGCIVFNSRAVEETNCDTDAITPLSDGIISFSATAHYTSSDDVVENACAFVNCEIRCMLADALDDENKSIDWKMEKQLMYDAINYNVDCGRCCTAAELYCRLFAMLENKDSCKC